MKYSIVLLNRAKRPGGHSIEEIFESISLYNKEIINKYVPEYRVSLINIVKNLIYAYKNKGYITHITGDIHYVSLVTGRRTILTIHDIGSIYSTHSIGNFLKNIFWIYIPTLFVFKITVVSEFTKTELLKKAPWSKSKIVVIPNPVNPLIEYKPKDFNSSKPVILHLGTKKNKNLENTILALKDINCVLVIVGKLTNIQYELLKKYKIEYENYEEISYGKVIQLYYSCDIVSFLSLYEGFGMPIIEAQAAGRVLITSDILPITKVAGSGAHLVDPYNINVIIDGFRKVIENEEYRKKLISEGLKNASKYSVENIANKYNILYNEILGKYK